MARTRLIEHAQRISADLEHQFAGRPARLRKAQELLLRTILTADIPAELERVLGELPTPGLYKRLQAFESFLRNRSRLPDCICAHYKYGQSRARVLSHYRLKESDWHFVHSFARDIGQDIELLAGAIAYEHLPWHDEIEEHTVRVEALLDPRALEDMLICALEAYLSPRHRKGYEVYGINLGMSRDVAETRKRGGTAITRYVSIMRGQPQMSAVGGPRHVEPSARSLAALEGAAVTLFPHYQILGDFHSHVFDNLGELEALKGWAPSKWDESFLAGAPRGAHAAGSGPQVDMIVSIARSSRRVPRSHFGGRQNTLQLSVGDCRVVFGAHRILQSGRYATSGIRLSTPGLPS